MGTLSKEQFLEFAESVYLAKLKGHPISEEAGGWFFGIQDADVNDWGPERYHLEVVGPFGTVVVLDSVHPEGVLLFAGRAFEEIVTAESRAAGRPLEYEYLPEGIKANLAMGHVLAEHTLAGDGVVDKHITTVQLNVAQDEHGHSVHYCNDVCGDLCEPGSVEVIAVAQTEPVKESVVPEPVVMEDLELPILGQLGLIGQNVGFLEKSVGELVVELEVLRRAKRRLETVRTFAYDKYREALLLLQEETADIYAGVLFLMVTEVLPSADPDLYERFARFLASSVIEEDAETLPLFDPAAEADCG